MSSMSPQSDYPASRFFRVLFSVVFCSVAALMMSSLLWYHVDGHYTHRAAAPLFLLAFFSSVFAGFIIIFSGLFYWLDRRAHRGTRLSNRQSIVLILVLAMGSLTGYFNLLLGAFFLFLLFYWFMTGRVAGRPGWSVRNFMRTKWDEKLYLISATVFFVQILIELPLTLLTPVPPMNPGTPPFQVRNERQIDSSVKRALHRFPDAQACLEHGANAARREDLVRMDWKKISTKSDAKVCSFRLLHEWGAVTEAASWLEAQGFRVGERFSSISPYIGRDGTLRVDGSWSVRKNGPRFPTTGMIKRVFNAVPYGMGVRATYSPDGQELLYLDIDFSTL
ncbi:MAG: hypothetical protein ABJN14_08120 [Paracoccaceae bacterium]